MATHVTASITIADDDKKPEKFHCPMAVLQSYFSSLSNKEGYSIKEKNVANLSGDMIIETLFLTKKINVAINEEEIKINSMSIVD